MGQAGRRWVRRGQVDCRRVTDRANRSLASCLSPLYPSLWTSLTLQTEWTARTATSRMFPWVLAMVGAKISLLKSKDKVSGEIQTSLFFNFLWEHEFLSLQSGRERKPVKTGSSLHTPPFYVVNMTDTNKHFRLSSSPSLNPSFCTDPSSCSLGQLRFLNRPVRPQTQSSGDQQRPDSEDGASRPKNGKGAIPCQKQCDINQRRNLY